MKKRYKNTGMLLGALALIMVSGCARINFWMGNERYTHYEYVDAIRLYEKALQKKDYPVAMLRLADAYEQNNRYKKAAYWYKRAMAFPEATELHRKRYAELMLSNEQNAEARKFILAQIESDPSDPDWQKLSLSCDSVPQFSRDSMFWSLEKLPATINSSGSNFSPIVSAKGLIFVSERGQEKGPDESEWTGKPYLDLFYSRQGEDGSWMEPKRFEGKVNGPWNEGPATINEKEGILYFTRNNYLKRSREKSSDWENNLQVFEAKRIEGTWKEISPMPFNSDEFSCGHPALSPDGKTLYFVSDMPGGFGGTDIYKVEKDVLSVDGGWSLPINLGPEINTGKDEMFPFVAADGKLYFASDGFPGMGGLDIFQAEPQNSGWSKPVNMHFPLNSTHDDFGFVIDPATGKGFLSSNRDNNEGVDEIYMFNRNQPVYNLRGLVVNKDTDLPLRNADVSLVNPVTGKLQEVRTDAAGKFYFPLEAKSDYTIRAGKEGFFKTSLDLSTRGERWSKDYDVKIPLEPLVIGKPIVLEDIYYDFDESYIREDAKPPLNKLLKVLKDNPEIKIELSSHTDARGSKRYNQKLSQARAESAVAYLIEGGIPEDRIIAKGYGESKPVNECVDGVKCEEEAHQLNRRTEFKVLSK